MFSSWRSADTSSIRCWVVLSVSAGVASSSLALGVLLPQPRWSKSTTRYRCGLKNRADELWLPAPRPAMHDDDRLAGRRAVFLPIDPMLGKSGRRQMTGPDEGWVRRLVVWRGCLGACIHGSYFCDRWEVGCELRAGAGKPAYAKIAAAAVLSFSETRIRHLA